MKEKRKHLIIIIITVFYITYLTMIYKRKIVKSTEFYYSGHPGTIDELSFVYERHNMTPFSKSDDWNLYSYLNKIFDYEQFISTDAYTLHFCNQYSMIMIGDSIRLGRSFYERVNSNKCNSKIALQIVDRYDRWLDKYNEDKKKFLDLFKELMRKENVFWLPNNNYELYYLNKNGIYPPKENTFLIRPYGVLETEDNKTSKNFTSKSIIYVHSHFYNDRFFMNNFKRLDKKNYEIYYMGNYGGPSYLKKHRIFIYFPYQFSIMKVFNNAINGIFTAIPSPTFFKQLASDYIQNFRLIPEVIELFQTNPNNWTEYFDVYNKKYIRMFLKFDNWTQFYDLVNNKNYEDTALKKSHYLENAKKIMKIHWNEVDIEWKSFFNRLNKNL